MTPADWKPLHPATLWLPTLDRLQQLLIPGLAFAYFFGIVQAVVGACSLIGFLTLVQIVRYLTFRYRVTESELQIRHGILWKEERRVVIARIQDVLIRQGALQQLFGLSRVIVKTAGHEEQEVVLDVIRLDQAESLKRTLVDRQGEKEPRPATGEEAGRVLVRLSPADLFLGAFSSKAMAMLFALVGTVVYFQIMLTLAENFLGNLELPRLDPFAEWSEALNPWKGTPFGSLIAFFFDETFGKALLFIAGGFAFSLLRYAIRYGRYELTESQGVLTKAHGVFSREKNALARHHVHALKVDESLIRRWLRLADVWVDSGGDQSKVDEEKHRTPFVPVLRRGRAYRLVEEIFTHLGSSEPEWRRVSPKAILRGTRLAWLILLPPIFALSMSLGWLALIFAPVFPLAFFLNVQWYRNRGFWLDEKYLISRKGWFNRETLYLPVRHIQSVSISRNPFDRRLGLATLLVDTAGQSNTGGGPTIRNLPFSEALRIQARLAASGAVWTPPSRRG